MNDAHAGVDVAPGDRTDVTAAAKPADFRRVALRTAGDRVEGRRSTTTTVVRQK